MEIPGNGTTDEEAKTALEDNNLLLSTKTTIPTTRTDQLG
jgi:hypothetical protein